MVSLTACSTAPRVRCGVDAVVGASAPPDDPPRSGAMRRAFFGRHEEHLIWKSRFDRRAPTRTFGPLHNVRYWPSPAPHIPPTGVQRLSLTRPRARARAAWRPRVRRGRAARPAIATALAASRSAAPATSAVSATAVVPPVALVTPVALIPPVAAVPTVALAVARTVAPLLASPISAALVTLAPSPIALVAPARSIVVFTFLPLCLGGGAGRRRRRNERRRRRRRRLRR